MAESSSLNEVQTLHQDAAVFTNEGVRVQRAETCSFCGEQGRALYTGLRDRLYEAPGTWNLFRCGNCGLAWLDPQPIPEDIHKLYQTYYTHESDDGLLAVRGFRQKISQAVCATSFGYDQLLPGPKWRLPGRIASLIPPWKDYAAASLMYLEASARGNLLDVGCGRGTFLASMRTLGWNVQGVEPDSESALIARDVNKLPVLIGTLEEAGLPDASLDAIAIHHVIEHVPAPQSLLQECCRLLRPGGRLVVMTPNIESLGHRLFGRAWFALDPPRHLHLFSLEALRRAAREAGLRIKALRTVSRQSRTNFIYSVFILREGRPSLRTIGDYSHLLQIGSWGFWVWEDLLRYVSPAAGEELLLLAEKPVAAA